MSTSQISIEDFKRTLAVLDSQIFASVRNTLCHVCHPISLHLDEILSSTDKSDFHPGTRDSTDNIKLATIDHVFSTYQECGFCSLILRLILRAKQRHLYPAMGSMPSVEEAPISLDTIREALKSLGSTTVSETTSTTNSISSVSGDFDILDPEELILQVSVDAICDYGALSLWLPLRASEDVDDNEFQLFLHPDDYRIVMLNTPNPEATLMIPKPLSRKKRDMDLMKRCLEYCRKHHDKCKHQQAPNSETLQTAPSRLIDVVDMKLVPTNPGTNGHVDLRQVEYVALSYVWGRDPFFTLQSPNLSTLCEKDAFRDPAIKLPQTILDAIEVTKFLGYRYIWIDSLCIEQDSTEDTITQIGLMHVIYAQASLTIVAAVGDSAQHSILHIDPNQLSSKYHTVGSLRFCLDRPEFKEVVESSTWATRGWTLQELTCSDRFLFFTPERTYFSCALGNWNEDLPLDESIPTAQYQRYLRDEDPKGLGLEMGVGLGRDAQASAIYISMVEKLSTRRFTHDKDILKASLGMYTMYMVDGLGMAVAGLPLYFFGAALMWQPNGRLSRRLCEGVPSWSWASWTGPISYPLGRLDGLDIQLTLDWFIDEFKSIRRGYADHLVRTSPGYIPYLQVDGRMAGAAQLAFRAPAKEPGHHYFGDARTSVLRRRIVNPGDRSMMNLSLAEKTVLAFGGTICTFPVRFREYEHAMQTSSHVHFCSIFSSPQAADNMDNAELIGEMRVDSGTLESFFPEEFSTSASNMGIATSVELLSFGHLDFSLENVQNVLYLNRYSRRGNFSPEFLALVNANPDMVLVMWLFRHPGYRHLTSRVAVGYVLRSRWDEAVQQRGGTREWVRLN
ncbi:heterokaryon incompatibility protein-domain-containing protein [Pseudoneurospora amorphoporcata]|uniref:Heterokaryon incompatibility protein-domain-containing protein n=1 Tax=Pseudoneurospora amorphoporcata TaxID=241081 RepID=A0AAN6SC73_9PEZI|nr:heterokaryon incompatibility protein-domain-containing protein [Pseudoneurospora amorphoporcata]